MTIRVRLTIWYCLVFGIILVSITSIIYFSHRDSHLSSIDNMLTSVTQHLEEEIESELDEGKTLSEINLSFREFKLNGVYVDILNATGSSVIHPKETFMGSLAQFDHRDLETESLHTIQDPTYGHFRMLMRPLSSKGEYIGTIQSVVSLNEIDSSLYRFSWFIIGMNLIGLLFAMCGGWILAKKALSRVDILTHTAKEIAASQCFEQRVVHEGPADEVGELAETFNDMLDSLEHAYNVQKRFIADASHELRAPLTTIRGNMDLLQKINELPPDDQREMIQDTRNEAIRMSKMVGDLLSLARADAGQDFPKYKVDLATILREVTSELRVWKTDVQVHIQMSQQHSVYTWGNSDQLKQLLLILLTNAIAYSLPSGEVTVCLAEEKDDIVVVVKDKGIGIPEFDLPHIFDRFYRSENARGHSSEGTGLGLSIAKWIIERHQGEIAVVSKIGKVTCFTCKLPKMTGEGNV